MTLGIFIDLGPSGNDRLYIRHCPIADTGVEIDRVRDGHLLWRQYVEPLGVEHSKYIHNVHYTRPPTLQPNEDSFQIISVGEKVIRETRRLSDGSLVERGITEN